MTAEERSQSARIAAEALGQTQALADEISEGTKALEDKGSQAESPQGQEESRWLKTSVFVLAQVAHGEHFSAFRIGSHYFGSATCEVLPHGDKGRVGEGFLLM